MIKADTSKIKGIPQSSTEANTSKIKGIPQSSTEAMRTRKHREGAADGGGCGGIVLEYNEVCQVQSRKRGISAKLAEPK